MKNLQIMDRKKQLWMVKILTILGIIAVQVSSGLTENIILGVVVFDSGLASLCMAIFIWGIGKE